MYSFKSTSIAFTLFILSALCLAKDSTPPIQLAGPPVPVPHSADTQTCAQTFTGSWLDGKKVKQWGQACSTTGNMTPNDVYQCKKVVSDAQATGCGTPKHSSNCRGGYSSVVNPKTKDASRQVFCRDSPGSPTMKCDTLVRPAVLGDCVKSSPQTYGEHANDWLAHAA